VHRARALAAWGLSATGSYWPARWAISSLGGGYILAYHNVPLARFVAQIEALSADRPISLGELVGRVRAKKSTAGLFAITFDDGVADTVREIARVCETRAWPVTFYLPTGYLDQRQGMPFQWLRCLGEHVPTSFTEEIERSMRKQPRTAYEPTVLDAYRRLEEKRGVKLASPPLPVAWDEVRGLASSEIVSFESHGVSHTALAALSPAELEHELLSSQARIEEHTGKPCRHFCYPFGGPESIGPRAVQAVARVYDSGTSMMRGRVRGRAPELLPRIPIYARDDGAMTRLKTLTP
jgi:peptidoglycan/xylan/chitin deacetylase (PgdA/CDA1 family)